MQLCRCNNVLLLKGETLLLPTWRHSVPCSFWCFSDLPLSCDRVNKMLESVCAQCLCFWDKEQEPSPQTPPSSWYRKPYSLRWGEAGCLHVGEWRGAREAEVWDVGSGSRLCRSEHDEADHWLSAPRRAGQHRVQGCGTDPVTCLSVWGGKRLPGGSVDSFRYWLAVLFMPIQTVWRAIPLFSSQALSPTLDNLFGLVWVKSHKNIRTCGVIQRCLSLHSLAG